MPLVSSIPPPPVCGRIPDAKPALDSDASQRRTLPYAVVLPQKKRGAGPVVCDRQDLGPTQLPDVFCVPSFPPIKKIAVEKSFLTCHLKGTVARGVLCTRSRCPQSPLVGFVLAALGRSRKAAQFGGRTKTACLGVGRSCSVWGSNGGGPFDGLPCILAILFFLLFFFFWSGSIYLKWGAYLPKEKSTEPGDERFEFYRVSCNF